MKVARKAIILSATVGLLAVAIFVIRAVSNRRQPEAAATRSMPSELTGDQTPADKRIRAAQSMLQHTASDPRGYNLLAAAYMQKARETGDFSFNARAEAALDKAVAVAPDDYNALKLRAKLLLTYHRFAEALDTARRAQALRPDDHDNYGALTDALVELGQYDEAVEAAQRMVDLRPDTAAYSRVSYLRHLHGDTEGALEAMAVAVKAADPRDPEGVAWCYVQLGDELMNAGRTKEADRVFDKALLIFPNYYQAFAGKGRAAVATGDLAGAVEWYKRAQERVPLPDTASALGDLYTKLGRLDEAKRQYETVNFIEQASSFGGTDSRQLALFWADHDMKLDEALAIAQRARATRADIYTCDALAWSLFKVGRFEEAKAAMDEALRLGTRDARLFYHAGMIHDALGNHRAATKYLKQAIEINPLFDVLHADVARRTLNLKTAS